MNEKNTKKILKILDQEYGTTKEGFLYGADWQLLAAIMLSAQSTDRQVDEVLPGLWRRFPTLESMAAADAADIEAQIRSVGLYRSKAANLKKCCTQILEKHGGKVPVKLEEVTALPGVGRKTGTLFLADAYGIPGVTVDTHVFRISLRIGWAQGKTPVKVEQELMQILPKEHWNRINFQLIRHGRSICTARKAMCAKCPIAEWCEKHL